MSKQTPHYSNSQKTRAKYHCPKGLEELIYVANLLPKGFHFDLMEAAKEKLEKIEHLREPTEFEETSDINEKIKQALFKYERLKVWSVLFDACYDHTANWLEFYLSLPKEIVKYLYNSEEVNDFRKSDSYEYWYNNEDAAWDYFEDLYYAEEITDEEFEYAQKSGEVAEILIKKGYYGERWSYLEQRKENDDYRNSEEKIDFYSTEYFAKYRAYIRIEESRDFIIGLADLAEKLRENENHIRVDLLDHLPKKLVEQVKATNININKQGEISFSISKWAEAIQGIDISRIRRCDVCQKIFWAYRKDAFACSPKHGKTRQMRLLRANWKEKGDLYLKERKKKAKKQKESN